MKGNIANNPKIKLILGIAIPVLVMIVTVCMVGMSFAWFSTSSEVYLESISIVTEAAYTVEFGVQGANDNLLYKGQTAITKSGKTLSLADELDAPFYFIKTVQLSSHGVEIDYQVSIDRLFIRTIDDKDTVATEDDMPVVRNTYNMTDASLNQKFNGMADVKYQDIRVDSDKRAKSDIPYVFTWFFKLSDVQDGNGTYPDNYDETNKLMNEIRPSNTNEVWYTPYGKLTWNGLQFSGTPSTDGYTKEILGKADGNALNYDFYIIFAPEALFWKQYFPTINATYTDDQLSHIMGNQLDRIYYSSFDYQGAIFEFSVMYNVSKLYEEEA